MMSRWKNDYNLNLPRYIDSPEPQDMHDVDGHLRGGIPERDIDHPVRLRVSHQSIWAVSVIPCRCASAW